MKTLLLQNVSTIETRTVKQAVCLSDKHEYNIIRLDIDSIISYWHVDSSYVPIGSVEFVREFMRIKSIKEPEIDPYPNRDYRFLHREISTSNLKEILKSFFIFDSSYKKFIKPKKVKLFTGFIIGTDSSQIYSSDFLYEQICALLRYPEEELFVSGVVDFLSEWRYYIQDNKVIGYARYDEEGEDDAPEPVLDVVQEYAGLLNKQHPYVLDFGVTSNYDTVLVEYNAPWAIGLYGNAITPKQYLKFLIDGWEQSVLGCYE